MKSSFRQSQSLSRAQLTRSSSRRFHSKHCSGEAPLCPSHARTWLVIASLAAVFQKLVQPSPSASTCLIHDELFVALRYDRGPPAHARPLVPLLQADSSLSLTHVPPGHGVVLEHEVELLDLVKVLEFADPAREEGASVSQTSHGC